MSVTDLKTHDQKFNRTEYNRKYREANKKRLRKQQRERYQRKREELKNQSGPDIELLNAIQQRKKRRIAVMSPLRLQRRKALQQAIYNDLEREESIIV
ncbi:hypothetical protein [Macrococcus brunensis]|uniref:hypothetical protein n=1 Tax=Macrococcus brunensis TaxID=198483 RepID=UPI001EF03C58|nr:hypothetical protein [Macrococcus brunensis]ULG71915.1 hypothetical protein MGG12_11680 [Macrococcus brunensis]